LIHAVISILLIIFIPILVVVMLLGVNAPNNIAVYAGLIASIITILFCVNYPEWKNEKQNR